MKYFKTFENFINSTSVLEDVIEDTHAIPTIQAALPFIKKLKDSTVLTRTFTGIKTGAARISTTPPKFQSINPDIVAVYDKVMQKLGFSSLVYCSHGDSQFFKGQQYYLIPGEDFKMAWSPEVSDLLVVANRYNKENRLGEFPYDSYTTDWPQGNVDEVLVDCEYYFLISTRIPIVEDWMRKNKMGTYKGRVFTPAKIETYDRLYEVLEQSIAPYINK